MYWIPQSETIQADMSLEENNSYDLKLYSCGASSKYNGSTSSHYFLNQLQKIILEGYIQAVYELISAWKDFNL